MKLTRPHRPRTNPLIHSKPRNLCASPNSTPKDDDENDDPHFVSNLSDVVRGKQSWKMAFSDPFISSSLKPHHVEKVLIQNIRNPRLALRFFNFLGLHKSFNHSTTSFCILIHALVQSSLFWPATSLLQTLLLRGLSPNEVFQSLLNSFKKFNCSSSLGFDLLVQNYVQNKRVLDGVVVVRLMRECKILPEVRTLNALLNGLVRSRHFNMVLQLFDELVNVGLRPDAYMYTAMVKSLCELKDLHKANEVIRYAESNGCELSVVTYNVLIHGLCKWQRVWEAVKIKNLLSRKGLKADMVTYCTLVLGLCKVQEFEVGMALMKEMIEMGFVPSEAALSGLMEGLRRKGNIEDAFDLVNKMGEVGVMPNCLLTMR
ncbi:hypothetical protein M0R45_017087 [Rubus argutus]|uniref:Pentatricopeptide repeat-containing protein n=1 Tax=Rubus argutus TaxID=59490 RepID=A0AAW1XWZ3_RUBAR